MKSLTTGFLRYSNKLLALATLGAYGSVFISPETLWLAGFATLAMPVLMVGNVLFILGWLIRRRWRYSLYSLLTLLVGYHFVLVTVGIHFPDPTPPHFEVLSYNTHIFNAYTRKPHNEKNRQFVNWVANDGAAIKCFQEFYNLDSSVTFNSVAQLMAKGQYELYFEKADTDDLHGYIGLAIFSKFPIVGRGVLQAKEFRPYGAMYADLKIGRDTLRVYNIHLESMSIDERALLDAGNSEKLKKGSLEVFRKLKTGFVSRARQSKILRDHIRQCPHRVILCGDLNDLPYSYTYYMLRSELYNTFEGVANGFGFSYNGRLAFLRIDNQFYGAGLRPHYLYTLREVGYSDHFPLRAAYSIEERKPSQ